MIYFRREGGEHKRGLNITTGPHWIAFAWCGKTHIRKIRFKWFLSKTARGYSESDEEIIVPRTEKRNPLPPHWRRAKD